MIAPTYRYRATPVRVIDGDTYVLDVDLGFHVRIHVTVRLRNVDTPELHTPEGIVAKDSVERLLRSAQTIVLESYKDHQSFARWIVDMWLDDIPLADAIKAAGLEKVPSVP